MVHARDWSHLPEDLLTPENAEIVGPWGYNILYAAATEERLDTVPRQLLTEAALTAEVHWKSDDGKPSKETALNRGALEEAAYLPRDIVARHLDKIDESYRDSVAERLGLSLKSPYLRRGASIFRAQQGARDPREIRRLRGLRHQLAISGWEVGLQGLDF